MSKGAVRDWGALLEMSNADAAPANESVEADATPSRQATRSSRRYTRSISTARTSAKLSCR